MNLKDYIADIPDFPTPGILFRDVTPLLKDPDAYKECINQLAGFVKDEKIDYILGPEARGFLFGCPVATKIGAGFVPVRKPGKLPRKTVSRKYDLEYGSNEIHVHADAIEKGKKVYIVDDLLATGGTLKAAVDIVEEMGGIVAGIAVVVELEGLKGRELLKDYPVYSLVKY